MPGRQAIADAIVSAIEQAWPHADDLAMIVYNAIVDCLPSPADVLEAIERGTHTGR